MHGLQNHHDDEDQEKRLEEPIVSNGQNVQRAPAGDRAVRARHQDLSDREERADNEHRQEQSPRLGCDIPRCVSGKRLERVNITGDETEDRHSYIDEEVGEHPPVRG